MNNYVIYIVIFGSIMSLVGTMLGAFLGVILKKPSNKLLGAIMGFSAGIMLSIVIFDLIPEALKKWDFNKILIFYILGMLIIFIISAKINTNIFDSHMRVAFITSIGLIMHNFPEGIIMGCGFAAGGRLGFKMSLVIAIHDIPEGIAVAAPLMASKVKPCKILLYSFLTAFPTAIGSWIGAYIGVISENILTGNICFASGIMFYVACKEMIPESIRLWKGITSVISLLVGILVGLFIIILI